MTDKPTTPPAGEPTMEALKLAQARCQQSYPCDIHLSSRKLGPCDPCYGYALRIDAHTATLRADFERRMGMSQHALGAALKARAEAQSKLAEAREYAERAISDYNELLLRTTTAEAKLAAVQAELEAERGKEAPVDVFWKRMAESGHSYDAKAGIWWSDDSKPGVLADLEAKLAATEAERDKAMRFVEIFVRDFKKGARDGGWYIGEAKAVLAELTAPPVVPE